MLMLVDELFYTHDIYANGSYSVESDFSRAMSGESIPLLGFLSSR